MREYACTCVDMIARRLRLAFLNVQAAIEALPAVADIMQEELKWSDAEKKVRAKWLSIIYLLAMLFEILKEYLFQRDSFETSFFDV